MWCHKYTLDGKLSRGKTKGNIHPGKMCVRKVIIYVFILPGREIVTEIVCLIDDCVIS